MNKLVLYYFGWALPEPPNGLSILEEAGVQEALLALRKGDDLKSPLPKPVLASGLVSDPVKKQLTFPLFTLADLDMIQTQLNGLIDVLYEEIMDKKAVVDRQLKKTSPYAFFPISRLRFHGLGDRIFDGVSLVYLEEKGLLLQDTPYLYIGFEQGDKKTSKLYCSSHNYHGRDLILNSFGDDQTPRKDFYTFSRELKSHPWTSPLIENDLVEQLSQHFQSQLLTQCERVLYRVMDGDPTSHKGDLYVQSLLEELGYLQGDQIIVPVFTKGDQVILEALGQDLMKALYPLIANWFEEMNHRLRASKLIGGQVTPAMVGNELWHQIFGRLNNRLVESGYFQTGPAAYGRAIYKK